ncbi:hypothetical protein L1049_003347 [Liquidambar formosana]|uniref:30S ribosomal protein S21, chloroplastic n=1 Tax=Liquidambar formosana TaxID=63359 RepID=A0AAP0R7G3_LIQFO
MAASPSIFNFLSFLIPSKPPPPKTPLPPPHLLSPPPSSTSHLTLSTNLHTPKTRDGEVAPLVLTHEGHSNSTDISSVVCPSLAYSNTLFFKSGYNVQVNVEENEPEEKLINRFRREVMRAGVIQECKRRRFFENKQDEKKRRTREAAKRNKKRRPFSRMQMQDKQEASKKKDDDEEDNWELPAGDLP